MTLSTLLKAAGLLAAMVAAVAAVEPGQGTYTVLAPAVVRSHSEYQVAVTIEDADKDTTVHLELTSQGEDGANKTFSQSVVVPPNSSRTARLEVTELGSGNVTLTARGEGGVVFYNTTGVRFDPKSSAVFIQTDKSQYKPGQKVRLRVLTLDAQMKPTVDAPLHVHITDAKGNRVKQWLEHTSKTGIWSAVLPLSELPVLGDWTVTASIPGKAGEKGSAKKTFSVAEYVLPTFEVTASVPKVVGWRRGKIVVAVTAKYTYGKPVVGKVIVRAPTPFYIRYPPIPWRPVPNMPAPMPMILADGGAADAADPSTTTSTTSTTTTEAPTTTAAPVPEFIEKVAPIDGTAMVEFDMKKDLLLDEKSGWNSVSFTASVEEGLTGRHQNATEVSTVVRTYDYDVEFVDSPNEFTPGEPVTVKVRLTNLDESPIHDEKNPIKLEINNDRGKENKEAFVSSNGIATFELETQKNDTSQRLVAEYRNKTSYYFLSTLRTDSSTNQELDLRILNKKPKVGDEVKVVVESKEALAHVTVLLVAPHGIKEVRTLPRANGNETTTLSFPVTEDLAPASRIVAHGVKANGELITDLSAFRVDLPVETVSVRVAPGRSEPGKIVEVQLAAHPNATVAVLGVDQSVLLLKDSNNDIKADELQSERLSFESRTLNAWGGTSVSSDQLADNGRWTGYMDTEEESLKDAGLVFLTNAKIRQKEFPSYLYAVNRVEGQQIMFASVAAPVSSNAMPSALGAGAGGLPGMAGAGGAAPPRLRKVFPETWLWEEQNSGADGNVTVKRAVPDTITSWVVSAFAVDPVHGLSLSPTTKLTVFRPFFASLNLPYSVIRGETVQVPVLIFNYMDQEATAAVKLDNERGEFEFSTSSSGGRARREEASQKQQTKEVKVPAQGSATVAFDITPKKVGNVNLKVTATSAMAGDAVEQPLKVKAEGETLYRNKPILVDLRKEKTSNTKVTLEMSENLVPDSEFVEVSAVGDILGPSTANLDSLIRMPYGCGEQNMLNFVPNIVIMKYLNHTNQANPAVIRKARSYTEMGYQKELTYRHKDGSFSAFGESDKSGSTWLTAFVAKSFSLAKSLVDVEQKVIDEALEWLAKQQAENGSFPEVGTVSHRDMQGGSAKGLALTAYVLTAFLQSQDSTFTHQDTIKKSLEYLVSNLDTQDDPYAIAITTYALHVADHPAKEKAFKKLQAKMKDEGQYRWWSKPVESDPENPFWSQPNSVNVEMTSYALQSHMMRGLLEESVPIMQWLVSQRNSNGGFASTQDTVVGLQALAVMAEQLAFPSGDMRILFKHSAKGAADKQEEAIVVNSKTSPVLQKHELPRNTREVEVAADGAGFALAQVSWSFNEATVGKHPLFNVRVDVDKTVPSNLLSLHICSSFVAGKWGSESNMAVMEVTLASGFTVDQDALASLKENPNVRRVETKDQDSVVILYFDKMETAEYCVDVSAVRTFMVSNQKPVPVTVYDYYDQTRRARVFYEAPPADLADKEH